MNVHIYDTHIRTTSGLYLHFDVLVNDQNKDKVKVKEENKLTKKEKQQMEDDIYDLLGVEANQEKPIFLDVESINVIKPGKYRLDLVNLLKKQPLVYKLDDGKYMIDLPDLFKKKGKDAL